MSLVLKTLAFYCYVIVYNDARFHDDDALLSIEWLKRTSTTFLTINLLQML